MFSAMRASSKRRIKYRPMTSEESKGANREAWCLMAFILTMMTLLFINFDGLAEVSTIASVTDKSFISAYRARHVVTRSRYNVPDRFFVAIKFEDTEVWVGVDGWFYLTTSVGDKIQVTYVKRRITGSVEVVSYNH